MYGVLTIVVILDETNKIRSSFGVSANIYTTIGPLSFTLAQDLTKSTLMTKLKHSILDLGTSF